MTRFTHEYFRGLCEQDAAGQFYVRKDLNLSLGAVSAVNAYFYSGKYYPGGEFVVAAEIPSDQVMDFYATLKAAGVEYIYISMDLHMHHLACLMYAGGN